MPFGPRFDEALVFTSRLHRDQTRKGSGAPYVTHLLAVAALVGQHGGSETEAIAALLHDAIEDQGGDATRRLIRETFGEEVVEIVDECTDADVLPKPPWRPRKEAFLARLANASSSARKVCAADKLHNVRSITIDLRAVGDAVWEKFSGGKAGSLWYYRAVVDALRAGERDPLIEELDRAVSELERLARG